MSGDQVEEKVLAPCDCSECGGRWYLDGDGPCRFCPHCGVEFLSVKAPDGTFSAVREPTTEEAFEAERLLVPYQWP